MIQHLSEIKSRAKWNQYVRMMGKAGRAYVWSQKRHLNNRRRSYWGWSYLRYAKRACILAHQLPVEERISIRVFIKIAQER